MRRKGRSTRVSANDALERKQYIAFNQMTVHLT
jgi:hypothetical protein